MSKYEAKIELIIRQGIIANRKKYKFYKKEVIAPGLKYKNAPLRFDFSLKINDTLVYIEVDGEQHFRKVKFFKNFEHMKENDRRKNRYCILNKIPLYRIPYWEIDNIKSIEDLTQSRFKVKSIYHNDNLIFNSNQ